ncbi:MAG: hypothetical protein A2W90_24425 [Bacteroidetes bacterium GWF2_42_66]|nr:MAG: hypothetical protein A2W92_09090 [Bacteroidetes bacterium GWA2_42_15]OFX97927.1 MAG: hypothetical protein A2W89_07675 [Bacteroidetes bacterium GWE2_42_39]OFY45836.1 MAG: hypothetical protein A2W90_24425 [Bacteroidetes bacterium GWF2_42_66]HBL74663.1 hypothetical protein [Prolixibacteraceae bacterium]HCR89348.1 hypothetical protein [Prolixibacteraceae bacterium]
MSNENRISLAIPEETATAVKQHFTEAAQMLAPYLINLTPEEKKSLPKVGDKGYSFVNKGNEYLQLPSTPMPPYLNVPEISVDLKGYDTLRQILQVIMPTIDRLDDTMTLSGSEAYGGVLAFYNYIKGAAKAGVPGAQTIYDDLSARFPGRKVKAATGE